MNQGDDLQAFDRRKSRYDNNFIIPNNTNFKPFHSHMFEEGCISEENAKIDEKFGEMILNPSI
jgi:hypothetical protein